MEIAQKYLEHKRNFIDELLTAWAYASGR
jgi:hypothetical protein